MGWIAGSWHREPNRQTNALPWEARSHPHCWAHTVPAQTTRSVYWLPRFSTTLELMDRTLLKRILGEQAGVVARRQVVASGSDDNFIETQIRRNRWATVHRGVYVDHTGPLSWEQRSWAAVLFYWPAALCHETALPRPTTAIPRGDRNALIHVAIEHPRSAVRIDGVKLHRLVKLDGRVRWNLSPPRLRLEDAVLDVCSEAPNQTEALAIAADACQQRFTTPARLLVALEDRQRLRFARWLRSALTDIGAGVMSVLEHAYLRKVERAHGLPRARRQLSSRTEDGVVYRDVEYVEFGLVVELDGRIGHELVHDRWDDMDRDLLSAVDGHISVRLGWRHVEADACRTADRLGRLLQQRGWTGAPSPCGPGCHLDHRAPPVGSPARGAGKQTH